MKAMALVALLGVVVPAAWVQEGTATDAKTIDLFNGADLSGWKLFIPDEKVAPKTVWSVKDGVVRCTGKPAGYMRTEKEYGNYRLRFQWRFPEGGGNSGVLIHIQLPDKVWPKSIEGQLQHAHAGDFWVIDGAEFKEHTDPDNRRVVKKEESSEKPLGEWNQYEVLCQGNTIKLFINGVLQNSATETSLTKGHIGWQSEGTPIEFRNLVLETLD